MKYTEAFDELQQIVSAMEEGQIGIDELAEKVKRATELIRICRLKLTSTEGDVQKILKDLENSGLDTDSNS
ncbi:MAG: exodeoxyribonuclease VII small subunit [Bacteroidota bacterium]|nr:exodeoxyribonuclease VII small subunit [Bacteroidota bacterium]